MPIEALPQATVRAIGSSSVISDPCSVVKELLDNSLDASASSLAVEISSNTIDVIQVKDNGIGISSDDHPVVCRHACTSKIQTVEDLRNIGGTSFGFRGEALASMAEMSGGVIVTTRTASEEVGLCIKYGRDGEVSHSQRTAHPVGTTVRITDFLKHIPVRRQTVLKGATKTLTKIKKLLQAYAFAKPSCRFSLKVLKGKNESNNWMYVPSPGATISDAAVKIIGREASSCCLTKDVSSQSNEEMDESRVSNGYSMTAFLPNPDADCSKINNIGQYISLDGRPLNSARGMAQSIAKSFKTYIRSVASQSETPKAVADPFLCLQIQCPRGVYDVNIEPGKDDVLFEDREKVISLAESLFGDCYGQLPVETRKSPTKDKSVSSNTVGKSTEFDLLMANKQKAVPMLVNQPKTVGEFQDTNNTSDRSQFAPQSPRGGSQLEVEDGSPSTENQRSRFVNPWSITSMNTPLRTPIRHGRNSQDQRSLSPDIQRSIGPSRRHIPASRNNPQSPPATPGIPLAENARNSSQSPINRRQSSHSPNSTFSSRSPMEGSAKRERRQRDRDRYGNGALDTWFQRTTQISMGQTPLDAPANIDELVPTLSQLANRRFGNGEDDHTYKTVPREASADTASPFDDNESQSSPQEHPSTGNSDERPMDSGRGYPVLENWAASLKDGFNSNESSGLEWAMDFERRKKEANQKYRNRAIANSQSDQQSTQPPSSQTSQGPHQSRFLAAKAALAAERPFPPEPIPDSAIPPHDPRAYLMRHGSSQSHKRQTEDGTKSRHSHTSRLPFEKIPDGYDLHDVCLSLSTNTTAIFDTFHLEIAYDSYVDCGQNTESFLDCQIDSQVPVWTKRLQSIISAQYKGSADRPDLDQSDLAAAITKHVNLYY